MNPLPGSSAPPIENSIYQVTKEASLLYCLPDNPFFHSSDASDGTHAVQEATYACKSQLTKTSCTFDIFLDAGWIFAQHFCNRLGPAYLALKNVLDEANPGHAEVLNQIKKRFREETFTRQGISEAILAYPDLVSPSSISDSSSYSGDRYVCSMSILPWFIIPTIRMPRT